MIGYCLFEDISVFLRECHALRLAPATGKIVDVGLNIGLYLAGNVMYFTLKININNNYGIYLLYIL